MNIIGISAFNHDAACCLLQDGQLVAAVEEERFSRIKHDPRLPLQGFEHCLRAGGLSLADVDCIAYYESPTKKLARQLWSGVGASSVRSRLQLDPFRPIRAIREVIGYDGKILCYGHHLSHAAAAFHLSGFDEAAILVADGVGEWTTNSYWTAREGAVEPLADAVEFPHSIGLLYSTVTGYLGFNVNGDEYKVMGLAPYGKPIYKEALSRMIVHAEGFAFMLDMKYFDFLDGARMHSDELEVLLGFAPRPVSAALSQQHADLASSMQKLLEEVMLEKAEALRRTSGLDALCMSGGVTLNCVANRLIRERHIFKCCFFQPAPGDSGSSIGAAVLACKELGEQPRRRSPQESLFLGPDFSDAQIRANLDHLGIRYETFSDEIVVERAAELLATGCVIGWYQGPAEFGPRALGARSILADPRRPETRDYVNRAVKHREAFRPFAPAVLASEASHYFETDDCSPYMTETCGVKPGASLPAVTHVDGSARFQTVCDESGLHPLTALLKAFQRLTGCAVLLNTSFNLRGEPIVGTPEDALRTFVHSGLDALFLGRTMVTKQHLPPGFECVAAPSFTETDAGARSTVYTFF